ncbi:MFS transporter [Salinisphaera sp. SPP-AMP-43]|uniref:MFS transporter n=1 Tax=Salinisphaera sp. SPP-AMP-43 TaxID=3121288 RepID=UPI003C6DF40D
MLTTTSRGISGRLDRMGMPPALFWGYIAVLIFMIGDGVESNYLAPHLAKHGFTLDSAATIISFYGITVTIGSWLAGALSTLWGPRRVMIIGGAIWIIFEILFLAVAMPAESFELSLLTYGIRGVAYPMFAYAFLVWIQAATKPEQRGSATGWFWFVFTGGLPTLGSAVAFGAIPLIGEYATFWLSLVLVCIGLAIGLLALRESTGFAPLIDQEYRAQHSTGRILLSGIDILVRQPRVGIAGMVRIINTTPYFGFFIFLPGFFTDQMGFSQSGYLALITIMGLVGMSFNPIIGRLSDQIGWRKILTFIGGLGSAVSMLLMYFVPQWTGGNYVLSLVFACLYGITLCGYVPAAALIAALCDKQDKGNAMAIYCLAAGLSTFIGPALYRVLNAEVGITGVVWIYAGLYVLSAALSWFFLITPADPGERHRVAHDNQRADLETEFS